MIVSLPIYQQYKMRKKSCMPFKVVASSRRGVRNRVNQDAYLALPHAGIFAIADGIGSRPSGELASQLIMDTLEQWLSELPNITSSVIGDAIIRANQRVFQRSRAQMESRGMGSTLVLCWINQISSLIQCWYVGDSRAYLFRNGKLECLTQDHSATASDGRSVGITRALGVSAEMQFDTVQCDWKSTDALLLVSDGISDPIPHHQMEMTLSNRFVDGATRVQMLLECAEQAGGNDDKTILFVLQ